ncbi:MAG: DUF4840 domain-containing protein [Prevotella sp.]|nr:DUF4840 domain-containing protein [Prevotella sp.]
MKTFRKLFFATLTALVVAGFASCNSDDEDAYVFVPLTPSELAQQINEIQGTYEGSVYFKYNSYYSAFTDSTGANWKVTATDSVMTIENVPMKVFATNIQNEALKTAIQNDSTHNLNVHLSLYRPYGTEGTLQTYYYGAVPFGEDNYVVTLPLTVGEEQKNVTFTFASSFSASYYSGYYSVGTFYNKTMTTYLILKSVKIEGGGTYDAYALVVFYGKKS